MGVHWEVVGGLLGVSKGYKNHGLIGPGGYWRGLKVFLWNSLMFLTLKKQIVYLYLGGFQLLDLIIPELKSHVIPYKFKCSHWWKFHL